MPSPPLSRRPLDQIAFRRRVVRRRWVRLILVDQLALRLWVVGARAGAPVLLFLVARGLADTDISLDALKSLAADYKASLTSTGSRFAVNAIEPCAFVLSEDGWIRYVSRSKYLRELKGWIDFNVPVPEGSVSHRLIYGGSKIEDSDEVSTDVWFDEGFQNRPLVAEEAILLQEWNQCLSLIWFDDSLNPVRERWDDDEDNEPLLKELDGTLPWPSKSRRR